MFHIHIASYGCDNYWDFKDNPANKIMSKWFSQYNLRIQLALIERSVYWPGYGLLDLYSY